MEGLHPHLSLLPLLLPDDITFIIHSEFLIQLREELLADPESSFS